VACGRGAARIRACKSAGMSAGKSARNGACKSARVSAGKSARNGAGKGARYRTGESTRMGARKGALLRACKRARVTAGTRAGVRASHHAARSGTEVRAGMADGDRDTRRDAVADGGRRHDVDHQVLDSERFHSFLQSGRGFSSA
jgi:hypothetical protein